MAQAQKISHALTVGCGTYGADRSELEEADVAIRVLEHLRPLDARGLSDLRRGDLDKLAARADVARTRAPFAVALPQGISVRDRTLRRYLAAFGIESPARVEVDPRQVEQGLVDALSTVSRSKPRASLVHVVAPASEADRLGESVRRVTRGGATISWSSPSVEPALAPPWLDGADNETASLGDRRNHAAFSRMAPIVAEALVIRARAAQARGEANLRRLGVSVRHLKPRTAEGGRGPGSPGGSRDEKPDAS